MDETPLEYEKKRDLIQNYNRFLQIILIDF